LIADIEPKKPGYKVIQATIIVSPKGALLRESQEEFAKVSELQRGKLAAHKRRIVDAAIGAAYEQWRQFGRKLALASQLEALHPGAKPRIMPPDPEAAAEMGRRISEDCPELDVEVNVEGVDEVSRRITPDMGIPSQIELYEASVSEQRVRGETGLPRIPIERHPDGHKGDPDNGPDPAFGRRQIDSREPKKGKKDRPAERGTSGLFTDSDTPST
jgi:hypothetical protein